MGRHYTPDPHPADDIVDHEIYCDVSEATQILRRSAQRVRAYIREKDPNAKLNLHSARKIKGKWFIKRNEVEALAEKMQKNKAKRRAARRAKQRQENLSHLKAVLRMAHLDSDLAPQERQEMTEYLQTKIALLQQAET